MTDNLEEEVSRIIEKIKETTSKLYVIENKSKEVAFIYGDCYSERFTQDEFIPIQEAAIKVLKDKIDELMAKYEKLNY